MTFRMIRKVSLSFALFMMGGVTASVAQQDGAAIFQQAEPVMACVFRQSDETVDSFVVFHLAGFRSDGTLIYRTITAPIFELTVQPDGQIESQANPCKDDLMTLDR